MYLIEKIADFQYSPNHLGLTPGGKLTEERKLQRVEHMQEEIQELRKAMKENNLHETVDALGDLYYIAVGALIESGLHYNDIEGLLKAAGMTSPTNEHGVNVIELIDHPVFNCINVDGLKDCEINEGLDLRLAKVASQCLNAMRFLGIRKPIDVIAEIHRANMDRVPGVGKRGHQVDMVKPEGWKPPNLWPIIMGTKHTVECVVDSRRELYGSFDDRGQFVGSVIELAEEYPGYKNLDRSCKHALHMILEKAGRIVTSQRPHYKDNWVDIGGYAKLAVELIESRGLENEQ